MQRIDDDCDLVDEDANLCGSGMECTWVNALPVATTPEPAPKASTAPTAAAYHSVLVSNALKVALR